MKIITLFFLLCLSLQLEAQKSDSLTLLNQKTDFLTPGEFISRTIAQPEEMNVGVEEEKRVAEEHKGDQRRQSEERRKALIKKYGKEIGKKIYSHSYWIGMSSDKATESLGNPEKIHKRVGSWGVNEEWVYNNLYLYFENGILTSFQTPDSKVQ